MAIFNTVPPLAAGAGIKFDGERISTAAAPRNLLDNSDFEIAQAGYGGKHGSIIYAADRWAQDDAIARKYTKTYANGHGVIKCSAATRIQQKLYLTPGTAYTAAITIGGVRSIVAFSANGGSYGSGSLWVNHQSDETYLFIVTNIPANTIVSEPVLYEGTYADDTLPEYQPKGYGVDLAECLRYFYRYKSGDNGAYLPIVGGTCLIPGITFSVEMRISPSADNFRVRTWTTIGFTDVTNSISSKGINKRSLKFIELTKSIESSGLAEITADFIADL